MKKKVEKNNTINSNAYGYIKSFLHPDVKILDAIVQGKWLKVALSSGIWFSVKNRSLD